MFEETNEKIEANDVNTVKSLMEATQESMDAMERQLTSAPEASQKSLEIQIEKKREELNRLQDKLDELLSQ
jgi:hypothetical protein